MRQEAVCSEDSRCFRTSFEHYLRICDSDSSNSVKISCVSFILRRRRGLLKRSSPSPLPRYAATNYSGAFCQTLSQWWIYTLLGGNQCRRNQPINQRLHSLRPRRFPTALCSKHCLQTMDDDIMLDLCLYGVTVGQ
jgi:hypothetical protein